MTLQNCTAADWWAGDVTAPTPADRMTPDEASTCAAEAAIDYAIERTAEAYARSARELAAAAPCTACFGTGYVRLNVCKQCGGCG